MKVVVISLIEQPIAWKLTADTPTGVVLHSYSHHFSKSATKHSLSRSTSLLSNYSST